MPRQGCRSETYGTGLYFVYITPFLAKMDTIQPLPIPNAAVAISAFSTRGRQAFDESLEVHSSRYRITHAEEVYWASKVQSDMKLRNRQLNAQELDKNKE